MRYLPLFALLAIGSLHCKNPSSKNDAAFRETEETPVPAIPPTRDAVKKEAVEKYVEELPGGWVYQVELYETPKTFSYLLKLQFQEFTAQDTVTFPDFGIPPQPVLQKGEDKYVVLLGFKDKKGEFREYKTITATDAKISVKTTKRYTTTKYATPIQ